ncbi:hypothetical protein ANN_22452 [Periplaneta americana]|uniref:Uncharacterized protein n=1 Tax=Periplaneta americana TaxID=6978 RepID=A0ABQ8S8B9_PERAM|nr:hypothetical protein ANN_22452 [Periplaneta americana]
MMHKHQTNSRRNKSKGRISTSQDTAKSNLQESITFTPDRMTPKDPDIEIEKQDKTNSSVNSKIPLTIPYYNINDTPPYTVIMQAREGNITKNRQTCPKCSGSHNITDCTSENIRCPNCTLSHMATDDVCSTKRMEHNIIDKINDNNISRYDAKQIVTGRETYSTIALTAKHSEKTQQFPILKGTQIDPAKTSDDTQATPTGMTKLDKTHHPYKQNSR